MPRALLASQAQVSVGTSRGRQTPPPRAACTRHWPRAWTSSRHGARCGGGARRRPSPRAAPRPGTRRQPLGRRGCLTGSGAYPGALPRRPGHASRSPEAQARGAAPPSPQVAAVWPGRQRQRRQCGGRRPPGRLGKAAGAARAIRAGGGARGRGGHLCHDAGLAVCQRGRGTRGASRVRPSCLLQGGRSSRPARPLGG
jgi:hypothetical protein